MTSVGGGVFSLLVTVGRIQPKELYQHPTSSPTLPTSPSQPSLTSSTDDCSHSTVAGLGAGYGVLILLLLPLGTVFIVLVVWNRKRYYKYVSFSVHS